MYDQSYVQRQNREILPQHKQLPGIYYLSTTLLKQDTEFKPTRNPFHAPQPLHEEITGGSSGNFPLFNKVVFEGNFAALFSGRCEFGSKVSGLQNTTSTIFEKNAIHPFNLLQPIIDTQRVYLSAN